MPITTGLTIPFTGIQRQYNNLRTEILDVTDMVLRSGILMSGNWTAEFENWLRKRNSVRYAVTCHSGTQALEIIAEYFREWSSINPPKVLLPAMTFPATANAFVRAGWTVELIDVDSYGQMNYSKIDRRSSIQAICIVGLYGQAVSDQPYYYTDWVIEDAAQHWLADDCRRRGKATAISFDPTKNLANYGNGGAVLTDDLQLADYARDWVMHGKKRGHTDTGSNSRMSEVDCAQMMVKTRYLDAWQKRRKEIAHHWINMLKDTPVRCLIDRKNFDEHCFHKFVVDVDNRDKLAVDLKLRGIETKVHYEKPLWELPIFDEGYRADRFLATASSLSRRCLSLPIYPELTDLEVEYVIDRLLDCV